MQRNFSDPAYEHTQFGYWHLLLLALSGGSFVALVFTHEQRAAMPVLIVLTVIFAFFALCFRTLTVRDEGDVLALRFGPIPLLFKRIRYADITVVEPGRSSVIDGWGMHYILGRGWTYNIWGFGCVKLSLGTKTVRIGTDDVEGLAAFLRGRMDGKTQ